MTECSASCFQRSQWSDFRSQIIVIPRAPMNGEGHRVFNSSTSDCPCLAPRCRRNPSFRSNGPTGRTEAVSHSISSDGSVQPTKPTNPQQTTSRATDQRCKIATTGGLIQSTHATPIFNRAMWGSPVVNRPHSGLGDQLAGHGQPIAAKGCPLLTNYPTYSPVVGHPNWPLPEATWAASLWRRNQGLGQRHFRKGRIMQFSQTICSGATLPWHRHAGADGTDCFQQRRIRLELCPTPVIRCPFAQRGWQCGQPCLATQQRRCHPQWGHIARVRGPTTGRSASTCSMVIGV